MYRYNFLEVEKEINKKLAQEFNIDEESNFFKNKVLECEEEQKKILVYIEGIQDPIIKATFKEKFITGKSWSEVGECIGYSLTHIQRIYKKALQDDYIKSIINYLM